MRAILLLLAAAVAAPAADREFRDIVDAISDHYHTQPVHIPFFGLVKLAAAATRPMGAHQIDLAVFENLNGTIEPDELRRLVGGRWIPFVQVHSHHRGETTLIYVRPHGNDTHMLIATIEHGEATVVELSLNPHALRRWLDNPSKSGRDNDNDND